MTAFSLSLLGPFQVTLDGDPIAGLTSAKARALLAYLAVEAGRPHPRQALAALLWPEHPEPRARANLSQALFLLRATLDDHPATPPSSPSAPGRPMVGRPPEADATPAPLLCTTAQTIQFNAALAASVDVIRFTSSLDKCARHPHARLELCPACLERLQQTVPLYRGRFLEDLSVGDSAPYEEWALLTREHLHNRAIEALHSLAEGLAWRGDYEHALGHSRRQVELDPWREEAQRQVMRLLALSGRRSEALMQYETCRRLLAEELGAEPSMETNRLYEEIHTGALKAYVVATQDLSNSGPPPATWVNAQGPPSNPRQLFVAREEELAHLDSWLNQALTGQGRVGFVVGGSGSGKTVLLREFARLAVNAHPELVVAHGAGGAHAGIADPFLPFLEILRLLMGDVEPQCAVSALSPEHARRLQAIAPLTLQALLQVGPALVDTLLSGATLLERARAMLDGPAWEARVHKALSQQGAVASQAFLMDQVARVFQTLAQSHPLLVILDDLHRFDSASISLLFHLGRQLAGQRILILGAYQPEELAIEQEGRPHPLAAVSLELGALWKGSQIDLAQTEGRAFVEALMDSEPNHLGTAFREALYRHTGGQALFTVELWRRLQQRGVLVRDADGLKVAIGQLSAIDESNLDWGRLPQRVEAVISECIARLPRDQRELLLVASVEGEEFHAEVAAQVLKLDEGPVLASLDGPLSREQRLVTVHSLRHVGEQRFSRYRFRHYLFRQCLYHSLDPLRRAQLHQHVASALEALGAVPAADSHPLDAIEGLADNHADLRTGPEPVASEATLAWHWEEAGLAEKAAAYHFRALRRQRLLTFANDARLAHCRRCLDLLATLPESPRRTRLQYLGYHALVSTLSSMRGQSDPEVGQALRKSLELAEQTGDPRLVADAQSALARYQGITARWP